MSRGKKIRGINPVKVIKTGYDYCLDTKPACDNFGSCNTYVINQHLLNL